MRKSKRFHGNIFLTPENKMLTISSLNAESEDQEETSIHVDKFLNGFKNLNCMVNNYNLLKENEAFKLTTLKKLKC